MQKANRLLFGQNIAWGTINYKTNCNKFKYLAKYDFKCISFKI